MNRQWLPEEAWAWYNERPWIVGCNYLPSDCINTVAIWQDYNNDQVTTTIENELKLAAATGLNSVRMCLPYILWKYDRDAFIEKLDKYLAILSKNGMTLMPVFFDDCCRGPIEYFSEELMLGPQQEPVPGCHGGFPPKPKIDSVNPSYSMYDDPNNLPSFERFIKDIAGRYAHDSRIVAWDIWNEPGNSGTDGIGGVNKSLQLMEKTFGWVREMDPDAPLTAGIWDFYYTDIDHAVKLPIMSQIEQCALELSDVISFHYYGNFERTRKLIQWLREWNRPIIITEWLHRPMGNDVIHLLPLYKQEHIACYHWGLVNGKSQTHEPWHWIKDWDLDFSRWQHDIYRNDGTPYEPDEIRVFKELTGRGDSNE